MKTTEKFHYVYLLRCADGSLYCGWTIDPDARLIAHNSGKGAKYTRSRLPVQLVYMEAYGDRHQAMSREWHIKHMGKAEKEKLVREQNPAAGLSENGSGPTVDRTEAKCMSGNYSQMLDSTGPLLYDD